MKNILFSIKNNTNNLRKALNNNKIFKNGKIKALQRKITGTEYILICIPFFIFIFVCQRTITHNVIKYEEQYAYMTVLYGFIFIMVLGFLYLIGIRWRIIYLIALILFTFYIFFSLGRPHEYYELCDRDNAIRVGIEALLKGEYPYYKKTDLHNPVTPLPFTFYFYLPIYILTGGHIFYMTLIMFIIFISLIYYKYMDTERDNLILPIIGFILFSEWFFLDVIINSDIPCSMFLLSSIMLLLPDNLPEQRNLFLFFPLKPKTSQSINLNIILFAGLFGCILAMRIYFWLIGFVIFIYIYKNYGLKITIILASISLIIFFIFILPFYFYDPDYFVNEVLKGGNAYKFSKWRSSTKIPPQGRFIIDFLNQVYHYKEDNSIYVSFTIVISTIVVGFFLLKNKFHLLIVIALCYLMLLFFIFHGHTYDYTQDYVSLAAIPFIFSFLYSKEFTK